MADYSIQEVSELTGITVRSLRNYLRQYRDHLHPSRGDCNALVFQDPDVRCFLRIRTLLREGRSRGEILDRLAGKVADEELVIRRQDQSLPPESGERILEQLQIQNQVLEHLVLENRALRERLEVMEVRFGLRQGEEGAPALPAGTPRKIPVRRSRRALEIPLPYFLLRFRDGARALSAAMTAALFPSTGTGTGEEAHP